MIDAPTFLTVEEVVEIHRQQLEAYGGLDGIRDAGALESAVLTPQDDSPSYWNYARASSRVQLASIA